MCYPGALPGSGGEGDPSCVKRREMGWDGGAGTLEWGRHARVRGHTAPCGNIPPRWPLLVCRRGAAGGAGLWA